MCGDIKDSKKVLNFRGGLVRPLSGYSRSNQDRLGGLTNYWILRGGSA